MADSFIHPRDRADEFIAFYRDFLQGTPDELDTTLAFLHLPDGTPVVGAIVVYAGSIEEGEQVLAPLRAFGPPIADLVQELPYTSIQALVDAAVPAGSRYYWKSSFVDALSSDLGMDIGDIMTELKILYKDQLGDPLTTCALSCGTANWRLIMQLMYSEFVGPAA